MDGIERIAAERKRQIKEEGWSAKHDKEHLSGELLLLAACYTLKNYTFSDFEHEIEDELFAYWGENGARYKNPIRDLERAGALIAAEIDRLIANQSIQPTENHGG